MLHDRNTNDLDILFRLLLHNLRILDLVDNVEALDGTSKYGVFIIEPGLLGVLVESEIPAPIFVLYLR